MLYALPLLNGIMYGLILAMLIGPVFFALIRTSIDKGFKSGAYLALGIALSDALAATVVYFGVSRFTDSSVFEVYLGWVGGLLMIAFGAAPFVKGASQKKFLPNRAINRAQGLRYILEGLLLNLLNPFVYIFWLGVVGYVTVSTEYAPEGHFFFFLGAIATVFMTDLLKVYVANRITDYLNARIIGLIDKIAGLGLMAFGVRLLVYAIYGI